MGHTRLNGSEITRARRSSSLNPVWSRAAVNADGTKGAQIQIRTKSWAKKSKLQSILINGIMHISNMMKYGMTVPCEVHDDIVWKGWRRGVRLISPCTHGFSLGTLAFLPQYKCMHLRLIAQEQMLHDGPHLLLLSHNSTGAVRYLKKKKNVPRKNSRLTQSLVVGVVCLVTYIYFHCTCWCKSTVNICMSRRVRRQKRTSVLCP